MKKTLLFFALFACLYNSKAQTTYPSGVTGCIARYDFANSGNPIAGLADVSGNGNNASAITSLSTALGFRNATNKAMSFNGFNSFANVPNAANLNPTALTMIAVVKVTNFYGGSCQQTEIVSKAYPQTTSGHYELGFTDNIFDGNNCSSYNPTRQQLVAAFGPSSPLPAPGNYAATNNWYFVAASYDGISTVKYYQVVMDPSTYISSVTPIYTLSQVTAIGSSTQPLAIGKYLNPSYPFYFSGSMDEVVLFNKALTGAEIQSVYDYLWGIVKITSVSSSNLCAGQTFTVNYSVNNTSFFASTNTFTVQLSNASGSFASPVTVGSVTATGGGTINCTVPAGTATGTGYRLRIVGSDVAYTTNDNGSNINITSVATPDATSNTPVCQGQGLNLYGTCPTPGVTYNWSGPGLTTSQQNVNIPVVSVVNAGNYILTASLNGCTSKPDTEVVVVNSSANPGITAYISPNDSVCTGNTIAFQALITNGGSSPQLQWLRNGSPIPGETNATFYSSLLTSGDVIACKVTISGSCATVNNATSNIFTVTVLPEGPVGVSMTADPATPLSPWQTVTFTANVTNGGAVPLFQWKKNGQNVAGATSSTWSANNLSDNDTISVAVTSTSPCAKPAAASSQAVIVKIKTGVDDIDDANSIGLYPNPNKGSFSIRGNFKNNDEVRIEVLNITGQTVYTSKLTPRNNTVNTEISLGSGIPAGLYMLKLSGGTSYKTIRFSVEK